MARGAGLRRARGAPGRARHLAVLATARLRRAPLRRDRDEPRPPHRLHWARLVRPRGLLRPRRVRDGDRAGARRALAVGAPRPCGPRRRRVRARRELLPPAAPRDLLRAPHAYLPQGRLLLLPLPRDL